MRKLFTITAFIILALVNNTNAQTLGTKKNITLKLMSYECGDYCYIELQDITSKITYSYDNIDQKTKDNGILNAIQDAYYKNDGSDKNLKGKIYKAVIEYRKTDIWTTPNSTEDSPVKTGKKKSMWMINLLSK